MSPEAEHDLRAARNALPEPDAGETRAARRAVLATVGTRRARRRIVALSTATLVVAIGLGASASTLAPPSVTASGGPRGLGFLPEPGWYVLQSGAVASTSRPAVAVASTIPFARDDDIRGLGESSAFPYSTLLALPPNGIVIVVVFTPRGAEPWADRGFHPAKLPLRLQDARVMLGLTAFRIRHDVPLGQFGLQAASNGHNVAVTLYFGREHPDADQLAAAERQLAGLVVQKAPSRAHEPRRSETVARAQATVFDRTAACVVQSAGGTREFEVRAHAGVKEFDSPRWLRLPYAVASTGNVTSFENVLENSLVWISAGKPVSTTTVDYEWSGVHPLAKGTFALSTENCKTTRAAVRLSRAGLRGGPAAQLGESLDCRAPQRVLVRVRAIFAADPKLRGVSGFLRSTQLVTQAAFAIRTEGGKPLAYAETHQSGRTALFTARVCEAD